MSRPRKIAPKSASELAERYRSVRQFTEYLTEPLHREDMVVQTAPFVSPTKWHLAHTTWFFETFILVEEAGESPHHEAYEVLFNSYYEAVGEQWPRPRRGDLSRPTVDEIFAYREDVDRRMISFLTAADGIAPDIAFLVTIGLHHEQQHQELLLTDIKHVLAQNPLHPVYRESKSEDSPGSSDLQWTSFDGGLHEIGFAGDGFAYDNETPRHRVYLQPFDIASRPVTGAEFIDFIESGAYEAPELWLSAGWETIEAEGWEAPLYWERRDEEWYEMTLSGFRPVDRSAPVTHVSYYEADAFARWRGARLPTEAEWEVAAAAEEIDGNFVESGHLHPQSGGDGEEGGTLLQLFGDVWEWTRSHYEPYPGYEPLEGAIGEYNGKFMCDQHVLRGGSCATSKAHIRPTYRNFFHSPERWQFTGIRLARETT